MVRRWMTALVAAAAAAAVGVAAHAATAAADPSPSARVAPTSPMSLVADAASAAAGSVTPAAAPRPPGAGLPGGGLAGGGLAGAPLVGGLADPFALGSTGCSAGDPRLLTGVLPSGRTYLSHLPARYDPRRPYPVILAYHGRSQQARDIKGYSGLDSADAVVLYPQGRRIAGPPGSTAWEGTRDIPVDGQDVAFTRELLGVAERAVCVDPRKVSAVGASQGGGFASVLACTAPGTVSSIAAVAGAFYRPEAGGLRSCSSGPLRVLEFHGTSDPVIDYNGTKRSEPIPAWLDGWAGRDGCRGGPAVLPVPPDVTELHWTNCAAGAEVLHFRVARGNHGWPGGGAASVAVGGVRTGTISATTIMLRFLEGLPVGPPFAAPRPPAPVPAVPVRPAVPGLPVPAVPGRPPSRPAPPVRQALTAGPVPGAARPGPPGVAAPLLPVPPAAAPVRHG